MIAYLVILDLSLDSVIGISFFIISTRSKIERYFGSLFIDIREYVEISLNFVFPSLIAKRIERYEEKSRNSSESRLIGSLYKKLVFSKIFSVIFFSTLF